jgi:hypothetical protein
VEVEDVGLRMVTVVEYKKFELRNPDQSDWSACLFTALEGT